MEISKRCFIPLWSSLLKLVTRQRDVDRKLKLTCSFNGDILGVGHALGWPSLTLAHERAKVLFHLVPRHFQGQFLNHFTGGVVEMIFFLVQARGRHGLAIADKEGLARTLDRAFQKGGFSTNDVGIHGVIHNHRQSRVITMCFRGGLMRWECVEKRLLRLQWLLRARGFGARNRCCRRFRVVQRAYDLILVEWEHWVGMESW